MTGLRWLLLAALLAVVSPVRGGVILTLTPSQPLNTLNVGDVVTFTVGVQRTAGEQLDFLSTKLEFTAGVFTLSPAMAPLDTLGGIIPDPTNDFLTTTGNNSPPGFDFVDGVFSPLGADVIDNDGVFFRFTAQRNQQAPFTVRFDPASSLGGTVGGGTVNPTFPAPLTVTPGAAAVPEPASLLLWAAVGFGGLWRGRRFVRLCHARRSAD